MKMKEIHERRTEEKKEKGDVEIMNHAPLHDLRG